MKDLAKQTRQTLKKEFPNCKFSVTSDYNSICVALMAGPFEIAKTYEQLNHFYFQKDEEMAADLKAVLSRAYELISADNYTVSVDGDYGSIPKYYESLHIGKWDKHYVQTAA